MEEPDDGGDDNDDSPDESKDKKVLSVEERIAQELSVIKRPKRETRFGQDRLFSHSRNKLNNSHRQPIAKQIPNAVRSV
jgi:hypothetical protein